ncbi:MULTISPECIES: hypothetical protein [Marinobacter]|uniref:hypothetical protein n=1 Tax=Marinobacter TaxID=2742 RepID=UPI0012482C4C|nr:MULTISPECIES: hypothetical protein [Marinobacter]MBL3554759.1 hypothetical protein [Marinobacter sp. JB05H06]
MLVEHLIEPEFLLKVSETRRDYKDLLREFSMPSPRVAGNFPKMKNFRKQVLSKQSADASEHAQMRLEELLRLLSERRVERSLVFDGSITFHENLKNAEQNFFCGIHFLKDRKPPIPLDSQVVCIEDFEQGLEPSVTQISVRRTAEELSQSLKEFVRLSSSITLIDPYFGTQAGMWKTFILLLTASLDSSPAPGKTFDVLFDGSKKTARSCKYLADRLTEEQPDLVKQFSRITFKDIRETGKSAIHNRYLMSELGGVSIGHGFEESNDQEHDELTLLAEEVYQQRSSQFVELQGVGLEDEFSVS